jgi:hypothetical protein
VRPQKIRGQNRLQKQIEPWRQYNLTIDQDNLSERHVDYVKIRIHPWCDIPLIKSYFPEPKGKTKRDILTGLLDIYDAWKIELDKLGQPYYLKIWLCEPRFSTSQVVCAISDKIEYYNNIFNKADHSKTFPIKNYGRLQERLSKLNWDLRLDEDHHDSEEVLEPERYASFADYEDDKKWFSKLLTKPHTTHKLEDGRELYSFKRGHIWVGGQ